MIDYFLFLKRNNPVIDEHNIPNRIEKVTKRFSVPGSGT